MQCAEAESKQELLAQIAALKETVARLEQEARPKTSTKRRLQFEEEFKRGRTIKFRRYYEGGLVEEESKSGNGESVVKRWHNVKY